MNAFIAIKAAVMEAEEDAAKFYDKGNKAAGIRLRAALLNIGNLAKAGRKEVSELKEK